MQQTNDSMGWYQGTADAVRQHVRYLQQADIDYVLILSGDQLYRMDYSDMLRTHLANKADVTIGAMPVSRADAKAFGIMRGDESGRVEGFLEKPQTEAEMNMVAMSPQWIDAGHPEQGPRSVGQHGHLFVQSRCAGRCADQDGLPRLWQRSLSDEHPDTPRADALV